MYPLDDDDIKQVLKKVKQVKSIYQLPEDYQFMPNDQFAKKAKLDVTLLDQAHDFIEIKQDNTISLLMYDHVDDLKRDTRIATMYGYGYAILHMNRQHNQTTLNHLDIDDKKQLQALLFGLCFIIPPIQFFELLSDDSELVENEDDVNVFKINIDIEKLHDAFNIPPDYIMLFIQIMINTQLFFDYFGDASNYD